MSNAHTFDHSVIRKSMTVTVKSWPDGYYEVDFGVTNFADAPIMACMPLFSGKRPITQNQIQEIKALCSIGVETIIEVDFEPDPF